MKPTQAFKRRHGGKTLIQKQHVACGWNVVDGDDTVYVQLDDYQLSGSLDEMERLAQRIKDTAARVRRIRAMSQQPQPNESEVTQ
jgi:hypothetical protein